MARVLGDSSPGGRTARAAPLLSTPSGARGTQASVGEKVTSPGGPDLGQRGLASPRREGFPPNPKHTSQLRGLEGGGSQTRKSSPCSQSAQGGSERSENWVKMARPHRLICESLQRVAGFHAEFSSLIPLCSL